MKKYDVECDVKYDVKMWCKKVMWKYDEKILCINTMLNYDVKFYI